MQQSLFDPVQGINVLPDRGEALFYPGFLNESESDFYLKRLQEEYSYKQLRIHIYDKDVLQPYWEHQIAKTNKRIGIRLNITFRILKT